MRPYEQKSLPADDRETLELFKNDIGLMLKRCKDLSGIDTDLIKRIMHYYSDKAMTRQRNDHGAGGGLAVLNSSPENYLFPGEFGFIKYLHSLVDAGGVDEFEKLLILYFDIDFVPGSDQDLCERIALYMAGN